MKQRAPSSVSGARVSLLSAGAKARGLSLVASSLLLACTSDLNAPSNYQLPDDPDDTGVGPLAIECGDVPLGAVEASFAHTPTAMGGDESYTFESPDLPEGLAIDPVTGAITGNPTTAGTHEFTVNAVDGEGATGTAMCQVQINERVGLDFDAALLADQPYCLTGGSLLDYIVEGTGDGTPITCRHAGGSGDGRLPAGISISADQCVLEGTLQETRFGTHVFVMRGEQSGVPVHMPYCLTQENPDFAYDVTITHSGIDDATLVPIGRRFSPGMALSVGETGDPVFTITDPGVCPGNSCYYGYSYNINGSPFDGNSLQDLPDRALVYDESMPPRPIGFQHGMLLTGPTVEEAFEERPFVVNISFDYCLSMTNGGCADIVGSGDGHVEIGVIMVPEAS